MIELRNVHRIYKNGLHVLRDFSMRIPTGSQVAILGPAGSGKSSVMRLIAGIDEPQMGTVMRCLETSWIVPSYSFFSHYSTGVANVRFIARFYGLEESSYLKAVVEMSDLGEQIDHKLDKLPGAARAQLAIAMALCLDTDAYLFDDSVGVASAAFRQKCAEAIRALIQRGKTVIIATSTASLVLPFCTQAYCIEAGSAVHHANLQDGVAHLARMVAERKKKAVK